MSEDNSYEFIQDEVWTRTNEIRMPSFLFNPLPDNKILDWSKLKQIADILKGI